VTSAGYGDGARSDPTLSYLFRSAFQRHGLRSKTQQATKARRYTDLLSWSIPLFPSFSFLSFLSPLID
jgi:hypothetical protein